MTPGREPCELIRVLYPNFATRKALVDAAGGMTNLQRWGAAMAARPGVARGMKVGG